MLELIRDIFQSPEGSFGFVFAILALGFWLVHYVTKKVTEINASHSTLKCEMSDNKNDVHGKFSLMDGKIDEIRKDIAYLRGFMEGTYTNMLAVLIRDRYFTEKGLDISDIDRFDPNKDKQ